MSTRPIRVALVVPGLGSGGLERIVRDLALELAVRTYDPAVFCTTKLGMYADDLRRARIPVCDCGERKWSSRRTDRITAVSRATAAELTHLLRLPVTPEVIADGVEPPASRVRERHELRSPELRRQRVTTKLCSRRFQLPS